MKLTGLWGGLRQTGSCPAAAAAAAAEAAAAAAAAAAADLVQHLFSKMGGVLATALS